MSDEVLAEVVELLFGPGATNELVAKMSPTQSDLATHDKRRRATTAGLSAIGAGAGAAGLAYAAKKTGGAYRAARASQKLLPGMEKLKGAKRAAAKHAIKEEPFGAALVPFEAAGLGGEIAATHILHGDVKNKKKGSLVKKSMGNSEILNNATVPTKRSLTRAVITDPRTQKKGVEYARKGAGKLRRFPNKQITTNEVEKKLKTRSRAESVGGHAAVGVGLSALPVALSRHAGTKKGAAIMGGSALAGAGYGALKPLTHPKKKVEKRDDMDVVWDGEITKADADKQQIFGWASVVEVGGEPVLDLQGDLISPDEMEKAAYEYVVKSRKGGDMHKRDDWDPIQKSDMIESFIVTDEKRQAMGLPEDIPTGWWVGFQVRDQELWDDVKSGRRTGFSIHGRGKRTPL